MRTLRCTVLALVVTLTSSGAELIRLQNGFEIQALSHSQSGGLVEIAFAGGTVSVPLSDVAQIEALAEPRRPELASVASPSHLNPKTKSIELAEPGELLRTAALSQGIPPEFVLSVAKAESGLHPKVVSPKGAIGLMQLMPATASQLAVDASDPSGNALGGAKYLRQLLIKFDGDAVLALAAYNAGPGAVARYKGVPPYSETQRYISRVLSDYMRQRQTSSNVSAGPRTRSGLASTPSATE